MVVRSYRDGIRALSLPEVLVVVAVLSILTGIAITGFQRVTTGYSSETATRNLNYLNGAVVAFNQANWELVLSENANASDEQAVFNSLRHRNTNSPAPGSPYLSATTVYVSSSNSTDHRARWNGRMFEMVSPGTTGVGINLLQMTGVAAEPFLTNAPIAPQAN